MSLSRLKQARKKTGLSVRQMAILIDTNPSNLSKQECGKRAVTKEVLYGYRAITGVPITKLLSNKFERVVAPISERTVQMIEDAEIFIQSNRREKGKRIIHILNNVLANLSCLKEQIDHDQQQPKQNNDNS